MNNSHNWSKEDIDYLLLNFEKKSMRELSVYFGVSETTVRTFALGFGLRKPRHSRKIELREDQKEYIRSHFADEPASDIADVVGLTSAVVRRFALEEGLQKSPGWNPGSYKNRYVKNYLNCTRGKEAA